LKDESLKNNIRKSKIYFKIGLKNIEMDKHRSFRGERSKRMDSLDMGEKNDKNIDVYSEAETAKVKYEEIINNT